MAYAVTVFEQNAWVPAWHRPPIIRTCQHAHRSLAGAARCRETLLDCRRDGSRSALWYHADVAHLDGYGLSATEREALLDLGAR